MFEIVHHMGLWRRTLHVVPYRILSIKVGVASDRLINIIYAQRKLWNITEVVTYSWWPAGLESAVSLIEDADDSVWKTIWPAEKDLDTDVEKKRQIVT